MTSSKQEGDAIGQFGEGLKMVSAACLRNGILPKFRSRNWIAMPLANKQDVDEREISQLGYVTVRGAETLNG